MHVQNIIYEDFVNYKKPSMFIGTAYCTGKCGKECQNRDMWNKAPIYVPDSLIIQKYLDNPITNAIVFGGLEPFDQWDELKTFISELRLSYRCFDDVVIYSGYEYKEIEPYIAYLELWFSNIVLKLGRYKNNSTSKYDPNLGIVLASNNQYSILINKGVDKSDGNVLPDERFGIAE